MQPLSSVLITGCGGDIAQSIARIIRKTAIANYIIGTDIHSNHAGECIFDRCAVVPRADSADYIAVLQALAKDTGCDAILPTSEAELAVLCEQTEALPPLIMANTKALEVGLDKLRTATLLQSAGLRTPWTQRVLEGAPKALPCIAKPRCGQGSKGLMLVDDARLVPYIQEKYPDHIWQEYLPDAEAEYTCGLYRSQSGEVRTIAFRRTLHGDATGFGEVIENTKINDLLQEIATLLELCGSINIQLRMHQDHPMVFEINPRFSSTVMFRHMLGFTDVIWQLSEKMGEALPPYAPPQAGTRFYRGVTEYISTP